jgi:glycosyltransferase involved in cell wall biosynthesis
MKEKKILFIVNTDWFFLSHRLPIALEAINQGYEVHIATTITNKKKLFLENGLKVHPIKLHRSRIGLISIIKEFKEIHNIIRSIQPDIVHLVTIKPVLLGGIATRILKVPAVVFAVTGLGYIFLNRSLVAIMRRKVISLLYSIAFKHKNKRIIFQNFDDKLILSKLSSLMPIEEELIQGSGVDLSLFTHKPIEPGVPIILLAARLLKDKGVHEFVLAAKLVNSPVKRARFILVGETDFDNPSSVAQKDLNQWKLEGIIEHWGHRNDMNNVISSATIVVLPSYREGFPKILIEAAASGRAIITTDVPGCRDAIDNNITGILIPVKNSQALANGINTLLDKPLQCIKMGNAGRLKAENFYDINKVVEKHIKIYKDLLKQLEK